MGQKVDLRTLKAIYEAPRAAFIASADIGELLSGHSIPSTEAITSVLSLVPPLVASDRVLMIGAGSGYLALIVSELVAELLVIERQPAVLDIARANLAPFARANITLQQGEGLDGAPARAPFDVILAVTELEDPSRLLDQLAPQGRIFCLEEGDGRWATLVSWRLDSQGHRQRKALGPVEFNGDTSAVLIDMGVLDDQMLSQAREEARRLNVPVATVIQRDMNGDGQAVTRTLAKRMGMRFADADTLLHDLDRNLFASFSRTFLDHARLIPVSLADDALVVATDNPEAPVDALAHLYPSARVERVLVTPMDFKRLWSTINIIDKSHHAHKPMATVRGVDHEASLPDSTEARISPYLVAIYEAMLLDAVSEKASDIHLEVYPGRVRVRLRVDGELFDLDQYQLTPEEAAGVVNVIKTRAQLNIAEKRLPQGGRSRLRVGQVSYDLRIQTQPSLYGEHVVIRLLPQSGRAMGLDELGLELHVASRYRRLLNNPAGLVLIVGPTGSGKSTTLSAGLQALADDGRRKVITIEDPVEYAIENVQQTHVRSNIGFGFADAMRAFVRQDPDVILVGEIRDGETALEAARASQTGHLVLSTLHCNDAVDAVQRLYDLGLHPNSIASELLAVMAQRLAKRICPHCRQPAQPDETILRELFPDEVPRNFHCYVGKGCQHCSGRGTRGRIAVVEYMQVNAEFRDIISSQPPLGELRWRALDAGLVTMRDSALSLVVQGLIPLSELPRILPAERMAPEPRGGLRA